MESRKNLGRLESLRILLRHLHYYPGDKLEGVVELTISDIVKHASLEVVVLGEESTWFGVLGRHLDAETRNNLYYKQRIIIAGNPPSTDKEGNTGDKLDNHCNGGERGTVDTGEATNIVTSGLTPGTYTFPFNVVLPVVLPPSYTDNRGGGISRLKYSLKAKLFSGSRVLGRERSIFTLRMLPVNPLWWTAIYRKVFLSGKAPGDVLHDASGDAIAPRKGREESDDDDVKENHGVCGSKTLFIEHQLLQLNTHEANGSAGVVSDNEEEHIRENAASVSFSPNSCGAGPTISEVRERERMRKEMERTKTSEDKRQEEMGKRRYSKNKEVQGDLTNMEAKYIAADNGNTVEIEDYDCSDQSEREASQMTNDKIDGEIRALAIETDDNASSHQMADNVPLGELQLRDGKLLRRREQRQEVEQQKQQRTHGAKEEIVPGDSAFFDHQWWEHNLDVPIVTLFKKGTVSVCLSVDSIICVRGKPLTFRAVIDNSRGISSITRVTFALVNRAEMKSRAESYEHKQVLQEMVLRDHSCREHKFGIPLTQVVIPPTTPLTLLTSGYKSRTFLELKFSCVYALRTHTGTVSAEVAVVGGFDTRGQSHPVEKWTNYYCGLQIDKQSVPLPVVISPFVRNGEVLIAEDELDCLDTSASSPKASSTSGASALLEKTSTPHKRPHIDYNHVVYRPRSMPKYMGSAANPLRRTSWGASLNLDD